MKGKREKAILKLIHVIHGDRPLTKEEFISSYIAAIAFFYVTTYGLSERCVWRTIKECYGILKKDL